jgi:hypothetical protein
MSLVLPQFDPGLIVTALRSAILIATVPEIVQAASLSRARLSERLRTPPAILVVPGPTQTDGEGGWGNGRWIRERADVALVTYDTTDTDTVGLASLRSLRTTVFSVLEANRISPDWAPLRYVGGEPLELQHGLSAWVEHYATEAPAPVRGGVSVL